MPTPPNRERDECGTCDGRGYVVETESRRTSDPATILLRDAKVHKTCPDCTPPKDGTEGGGKSLLTGPLCEKCGNQICEHQERLDRCKCMDCHGDRDHKPSDPAGWEGKVRMLMCDADRNDKDEVIEIIRSLLKSNAEATEGCPDREHCQPYCHESERRATVARFEEIIGCGTMLGDDGDHSYCRESDLCGGCKETKKLCENLKRKP